MALSLGRLQNQYSVQQVRILMDHGTEEMELPALDRMWIDAAAEEGMVGSDNAVAGGEAC
jgi:hypothetical protein